MPDDLYESDILVWSEKQAALLRRLARGEGLNEAVDWDHVIEEVGDVGLSELHACESHLRQALAHLLKLRGEPDSQAGPHWRGEAVNFLVEAQSRFSPLMRQRIDLDKLYRSAIRQYRASGGAVPVADRCPYTLDELLDDSAEMDSLIAQLG
jgi:hypothetical protein